MDNWDFTGPNLGPMGETMDLAQSAKDRWGKWWSANMGGMPWYKLNCLWPAGSRDLHKHFLLVWSEQLSYRHFNGICIRGFNLTNDFLFTRQTRWDQTWTTYVSLKLFRSSALLSHLAIQIRITNTVTAPRKKSGTKRREFPNYSKMCLVFAVNKAETMRLAFVDDCRTPVSTMSTPCEQAPWVVENSWKLPNMNHIDLTWFDSTSIVDGLSLSIYLYIYISRIPTYMHYKVTFTFNHHLASELIPILRFLHVQEL